MLEARRNEKNFQQRRNESYAKAHAELVISHRIAISTGWQTLIDIRRRQRVVAKRSRSRARVSQSYAGALRRPGRSRDQARSQ